MVPGVTSLKVWWQPAKLEISINLFFRARYNPWRNKALIRAPVIRPGVLLLYPTDETDYSSYQINLCLRFAPLHHPGRADMSSLHENSLNRSR